MRADLRLSRRTLLAGAVLTAAGCSSHHSASNRQAAVDPDAPLLVRAHDDEATLIAGYDALLAHATGQRRAQLLVQRAAHSVHLEALAVHRNTASASASAAVVPRGSQLQRELTTSARRLQTAAETIRDGGNAALLASIAASHQAMSTA